MKALTPLPVLVVDDEPRSLETLRRTLEEDFTVFTAVSYTHLDVYKRQQGLLNEMRQFFNLLAF